MSQQSDLSQQDLTKFSDTELQHYLEFCDLYLSLTVGVTHELARGRDEWILIRASIFAELERRFLLS